MSGEGRGIMALRGRRGWVVGRMGRGAGEGGGGRERGLTGRVGRDLWRRGSGVTAKRAIAEEAECE